MYFPETPQVQNSGLWSRGPRTRVLFCLPRFFSDVGRALWSRVTIPLSSSLLGVVIMGSTGPPTRTHKYWHSTGAWMRWPRGLDAGTAPLGPSVLEANYLPGVPLTVPSRRRSTAIAMAERESTPKCGWPVGPFWSVPQTILHHGLLQPSDLFETLFCFFSWKESRTYPTVPSSAGQPRIVGTFCTIPNYKTEINEKVKAWPHRTRFSHCFFCNPQNRRQICNGTCEFAFGVATFIEIWRGNTARREFASQIALGVAQSWAAGKSSTMFHNSAAIKRWHWNIKQKELVLE